MLPVLRCLSIFYCKYFVQTDKIKYSPTINHILQVQMNRLIMTKYASLLLLLLFMTSQNLTAQEESMDKDKVGKNFKNVVRMNITNPLIFGSGSIVLGYERVLNKHQSFSVNVGRMQLPKFGLFNFSDSTAQINKSTKESGFSVTGDYRFYLASENKYAAPRGLYIGPYATFVKMGRENSWDLNTDNFEGKVGTNLNLQFFAAGVQLGYQFVIWKRVALDFVLIGPGIAFYELSAGLDTDLDPNDESILFDKIDEILQEKFPAYNFVFDGSFKKSGSAKTTSIGYRYVIHLGFLF